MTETFIRVSDDVDSLPAAWAFVMAHVDRFPAPNIEIRPVYTSDGGITFSALVSGVTE